MIAKYGKGKWTNLILILLLIIFIGLVHADLNNSLNSSIEINGSGALNLSEQFPVDFNYSAQSNDSAIEGTTEPDQFQTFSQNSSQSTHEGNSSSFEEIQSNFTADEESVNAPHSSIPSDSVQLSEETSSRLEGTETVFPDMPPCTKQVGPAIYGDRIVWEDWRGGWPQIYLYNATSGDEEHLFLDSGYQTHPDIWEDWVVWQNYGNEGYSIQLYNLENRNLTTVAQVTGDWAIPRISSNTIVWSDLSDIDAPVFCYNIQEQSTLTLTSMGGNPDIWNDTVVWEDWRDQENWYYHIYTYDLGTGTETQITGNPSYQQKPRISGDNIVYVDGGEIHTVNLVTGVDMLLNAGGYGDNPVIYGDLVAYEDCLGDTGIAVISLADGAELYLDAIEQGAQITAPDLGDGRMVYVNTDNAGDICLYTFGLPDYPFSADFTENATTGAVPLTVAFEDTSIGSPKGWKWDFGDGNDSVVQNPVYTYSTPGLYTVTLWTFDPAHRDACRKTGLIAAGSSPEAEFETNVSCGPSPQTIQFIDLSGGSPTEWQWDFGDGGQSSDQNPVHEFSAPGIYNVSLLVANMLGNDSIEKANAVTILPVCRNEVNFVIPGISVADNGTIRINISTVSVTYPEPGDKSVIEVIPDSQSGISSIFLLAAPGTEFIEYSTDSIEGTLSGLLVHTNEMAGSSSCVDDASCQYNLSFLTGYYPEGLLNSTVWKGVTPEDEVIETRIAIMYNSDLYRTAYTVRFEENTINFTGPVNLTFGISSDWLEENGWGDNGTLLVETDPEGGEVYVDGILRGRSPATVTGLSDGPHEVSLRYAGFEPVNVTRIVHSVRDSVGIMRIGDDGQGDLLPAEFLYHDPGTNMDYFKVVSPEGLSRFSLVTLGKSGNIPQMIYLTIQKAVSGGTASAGSGGGGGYGGSGSAVASQEANTVVNPTPVQTAVVPKETKAAVSGGEMPPAAAQASGPVAANTPVGPGEAGQTGGAPIVSQLPFTMALLKNLSVVFLVFFITIVLYVRWRRSGGGKGNE
jgi:beta propeller repeat protein